jgi:hypothetical protein
MHDSRAVFAMRLDGCGVDGERQLMLDAHGAVVDELRRRGHGVSSNVVHDDLEGEVITIRILDDAPSWSLPEPEPW